MRSAVLMSLDVTLTRVEQSQQAQRLKPAQLRSFPSWNFPPYQTAIVVAKRQIGLTVSVVVLATVGGAKVLLAHRHRFSRGEKQLATLRTFVLHLTLTSDLHVRLLGLIWVLMTAR